MNRSEAKKLLPIITAFADGEDVQFFTASRKRWMESPNPNFTTCVDWRIKPKPVEGWATVHHTEGVGRSYVGKLYGTRSRAEDAMYLLDQPGRVVFVREVEE